ncbi:MAG: hypothetical protein O3C60_20455 [Planctomycetota bacterium]|nr:hypothetical protein [Planctomycetota bacterium]
MRTVTVPKPAVAAAVVLAALILSPASAIQIDPGNVVAYAGRPFGVGRITLAPPNGPTPHAIDREAFELRETNGRVLYPVFSTGPILRFVRNLLGRDNYRQGDIVQIWFLFQGDDPLQLELLGYDRQQFHITPQSRPQFHDRELRRWWDAYLQHATQRVKASDYPPLVETYLTNMLAKRLGLAAPKLISAPRPASEKGALSLLLSPESLHLELVEELMRAVPANHGAADQPLPDPIPWERPHLATGEQEPNQDANTEVKTEPLADHVPEECFYIRFGSFDNFRWFRAMLRRHGGDLARMVTLRAHDNGANQRMEEQLAIKEGALAALLAGQVISDVALIGRDLFLQDGAAIGILFETRLPLLGQDIQRQRRLALESFRDAGATETFIELAGQKVSFISTPDNRLRSFYVQDGRYHLVTTSQWIAEHFLLAGQGKSRLSATPDFQAIRRVHTADTPDTAWVYMSTSFLEGLFEPHYQIELQRRLTALAEMELQLLASAAARVEHLKSTDVASLQSAQLLPSNFGRRVDGATVATGDGIWSDSLRGRRGTFTPIPDVPIEKVSTAEVTKYRETSIALLQAWQQLDPVMVAIRREKEEASRQETVALRVRMLPFQRAKLGPLVDLLGPPSTIALQPASDDIIFAEAVLRPEKSAQTSEGQHLFLGVKDALPQHDLPEGRILLALRMFSELPAYLGAWPEPGWLEKLPWVRRARTDEQGIARLPSGLWRYQSPQGTTLISFHRDVLESATAEVKPLDNVEPAQLRFRVGNIADSALREWTRDQEYTRAWQASQGNIRLLHTMTQQFGIPREESQQLVQQLLNVKLICPLNGTYELRASDIGLRFWTSTALDRPKEEYLPPLLNWFRGGHGHVTVEGVHLDGKLQFLVEEPSKEETIPLPNANALPGF